MPFHERLKRRTITLLTDLQADLRAAATNHTRNRWPISVPGAMTTGFIGTAAGWVSWISVMMAFLAGLLVEFIGLSHVIRQRAEGGESLRANTAWMSCRRERRCPRSISNSAARCLVGVPCAIPRTMSTIVEQR